MMSQTTFDPIAFKTTTRQQWDTAAAAWHRWTPLLAAWLGPATDRMLELARVQNGSRVLDVAAGAGEQSLRAARLTGPSGHVLATDLSPAILEFAAHDAAAEGLMHLSTRELDGEALHSLPAGSMDAVISRLGVIYFPDRTAALAGMHHVLRPGGRIGLMVYSTPERNGFFSLPVSIIRRRAQLPPPAPSQPGPFSLGTDGALAAVLEAAGFRDVAIEAVGAPVRLRSAAECVQFERESFGALHQMMSRLSESEQDDTWTEIADALTRFEGPEGFVGPCELLVATAAK
jgi:ubiquinone/menaquinone biosynthesis C-methylase UbiE